MKRLREYKKTPALISEQNGFTAFEGAVIHFLFSGFTSTGPHTFDQSTSLPRGWRQGLYKPYHEQSIFAACEADIQVQ